MAVLNSKGWIWWIERGKLAVSTTSNGGATVSPPSSSNAGKTIRVYCKEFAQVYRPATTDEAAEFSTGASINYLFNFMKLSLQKQWRSFIEKM